MRVISWNMNKRKNDNWNWLIDNFDPGFVLAQESSKLPEGFEAAEKTTSNKNNRSAFFAKSRDFDVIKTSSDHGMGVLVTKSEDIFFICVYANLSFKPVVNLPLLGIVIKYISSLRRGHNAKNILIAGDFNMDRRMDENPTGTRFASKGTYPTGEFFDAILDQGFYDCMRKFDKNPVQTHQNNKSDYPWELDHMFVTKELYDRLQKIVVHSHPELSDHYPIVADFL